MTAEEENGATPAAGMPTGAGRVARPPAAIGVIGDGRATAARSMCSLWKDRSIAGGWGQQEGRAYRIAKEAANSYWPSPSDSDSDGNCR